MSESLKRGEGVTGGRTSVCRNCGALVGAGESSCSVCGAPAGQSPRQEAARPVAQDPESLRFVRAIVSRPAIFTIVFIVANVFLYLLVILSGGPDQPGILVYYGAKLNVLIEEGQWWRFVTPIFLHGSFFHLFVNMYGLFVLGPYVEKLYGSARFVFFWVTTGIAGVVASYYSVQPELAEGLLGDFFFRPQDAPSVGASGALFGLVGVLFVFGIKFRDELPEGFKRAFGTGMLPVIVINLFIGFVIPFIDNAAHLGGLVSGMVLALFVGYKRPGERGPVAVAWHAAQILAGLLVLVCFFMVARNYQGPTPGLGGLPGSNVGGRQWLANYLQAINEAATAVSAALKGDGDPATGVVKRLEAAPPFDPKETELREELKAILKRAEEFGGGNKEERESRAGVARANDIASDYVEWEKKYQEWARAEGPKYGIIRQESAPEGSAKEK